MRPRIEAVRKEVGAPALAAGFLWNGSGPIIHCAGETRIGNGQEPDRDAVWHLGSITKPVTATLVARLVDRGIIRWCDTVGDLLGADAGNLPVARRQATLQDLLCHKAGLAKDLPPQEFEVFHGRPATPDSRREYAIAALRQPGDAKSNGDAAYSNNGYVVVGALLEACTAQPWEELVRDHVASPLHLATLGFGPPPVSENIGQPIGHRDEDGRLIPDAETDNPHALGPAGRIHMSMADLLRFADAHCRRDPEFLRAETYERLHTPIGDGIFTPGWARTPENTFWHNGSNGLWYAVVSFWPDDGLCGALAINRGDRPVLDQVLFDLLTEFG